jgi:hypothetical protein
MINLPWSIHNDVVDGDVDELDGVADESHDDKSNRNGLCDLDEF